ncbi:MAG: hypothetical protein IAG10_05940 [Planctomycetaceae bacterium]|nr:hypothetical protein [Planctomycetaceae bacterium]
MKKHWLVTLGIYCLGVATLPGVLGGVRWWQNADGRATPKFIQVRDEAVNVSADTDFLDESVPIIAASSQQMESNTNSLTDEASFEFNSAAAARETKPVRVNFASEVEPPVLAQNSPKRNPPRSRASDATFEPSLDLPLEDFGEVVLPKSRATPDGAKAELPDGIESLADANLSEEEKAKLTTMREKLAELTKAKAELINEQTLTETITALEKQISDLHAAQKLLSAQQILKALAEEFPDSPAAAKAQRMLEAAESRKTPKSPRESFDFEAVPRS